MWHCFKLRCVRNPGTFSARPRQSFALDFLNIPQSFLFTRSPSFQPCCHFQSVFSLAPILLQIKGVQLTFCDENVGCQVWLWGTDSPAPKFWLNGTVVVIIIKTRLGLAELNIGSSQAESITKHTEGWYRGAPIENSVTLKECTLHRFEVSSESG